MERRGRIQLRADEEGGKREASKGLADARKRRVSEKEGRVEKGRIYPQCFAWERISHRSQEEKTYSTPQPRPQGRDQWMDKVLPTVARGSAQRA
jgi:hypothetical protein